MHIIILVEENSDNYIAILHLCLFLSPLKYIGLSWLIAYFSSCTLEVLLTYIELVESYLKIYFYHCTVKFIYYYCALM